MRKDNGKKYKVVYEVSRISVPYYAPGTRVIHLRGSEYLIRPDDKPGAYVCPLCANTLNERYCPRCEVDLEKELPAPDPWETEF